MPSWQACRPRAPGDAEWTRAVWLAVGPGWAGNPLSAVWALGLCCSRKVVLRTRGTGDACRADARARRLAVARGLRSAVLTVSRHDQKGGWLYR